MLTFAEIKELIELVSRRGLGGLEVERAGFRLRIDGQRAVSLPPAAGDPPAALPRAGSVAAPPSPADAAAVVEPAAVESAHDVLNSPIVGTFYRSPAPEAPAFVEIGSRVRKGQVLCIVEAMKIMNEIESEQDGVVAEIFPQNGQPVEFGEPLFALRQA